jgi:hypothetical protein
MGYGSYSHEAHEALIKGRSGVPAQKVFTQSDCHPLMNPKGVKARECRDSPTHPQSLGIVFALDVTGSMGDIPRLLATRELPKFMKVLTDCEVADPQVLFLALGDATCDRAPLQVGQFESTAELMDQWLTWCFIEGGGGNLEESYELALYFLALHTEMDCWVKRRKRGYMFMTGDAPSYPSLSRHVVDGILGDRLDDDLKTEEVVAELQKTFVPFFVIPEKSRAGNCERHWRDLLGDHVLCLESPEDVCYVTAGTILLNEGRVSDLDALAKVFEGAALPKGRRGHVLSALKPFAETLRPGGGRKH